jgi:DNA-binding SARP family transcriptional activator
VAALAALTGGLPAVLYAAAGSPVPRRLPSWPQVLAALGRPEDPAVFLAVIRAVTWLAWAVFTACAVAQAAAVARGRAPRRLPGSGPLRRLAAVLVSSAMLSATAAPASARAAAPQPARVTATAPVRPGPRPAARAAAPARYRAYRVRPGDNLWDIAASHLGDGEAWHQIWALNQGRPQSDGGTLTRPDLIEPGWMLWLPPAPGRPAGGRPAPAPSRRSGPPAAPGPALPGRPSPGGRAGHQASAGIRLPSGGLAGAGLALAVTTAVALAAVQRRRRYRPGQVLTSRLGPAIPAAPPPVAVLRRAAPRPGAGTAAAGSGRGPVPGAAPPPGTLAAAPLPLRPGAGAGHPGPGRGARAGRPGEVAVGVRDGREVAASLPALGGLGLAGPGAAGAARAILAALLSQALPGSPFGPADVIMTRAAADRLLPGYQPPGRALPGLTVAPTLDAALDRAEEIIIRRARITAGDDNQDADGKPAGLPPAVLIAVPGQPGSARLRAVLQAGRGTGLAGILLGPWAAGTAGHVTADGTLACDDPDLDGTRLFHLAAADTTAILAVLAAACAPPPGAPEPGLPPAPPGPPRTPPPPAPPAARGPAPGTGGDAGAGRPGVPPPRGGPAAAGPGAGQPLPAAAGRLIRVEVLGPLRITAAGTEIRGGLRKARELAAFLAVHPAGATADAIAEALWPGSPHGAAQRALALRRLRDLLRQAAGVTEPRLVLLSAGRYRLDPSLVSTDYADFQAALDNARTAAGDQARLDACRSAAGLYRGPLADGAGYDWAEPYAETARRRALDTLARTAQILGPQQPDEALAALETALGHDPYNEWVYQAIMRLQAAAGRPDAVRRTLTLLEARLADLGVAPGAQTRELAAALLGAPARPPRPL